MQLNTIAGRTYNDLSQYPVVSFLIYIAHVTTWNRNDSLESLRILVAAHVSPKLVWPYFVHGFPLVMYTILNRYGTLFENVCGCLSKLASMLTLQ